MIGTTEKIIFGLMILIVIALIVLLIYTIQKNRSVTRLLKPTRYLNEEDLKAIQYIDLDARINVDLLLFPRLPKGKLAKSVWVFENIDFSITQVYRYKQIIYHFYLKINGKTIEVIVPNHFLPYLYEGGIYRNKTIEILYRKEFFVLYSIHGVIGYTELYEKFKADDTVDNEITSKRPATKEELNVFMSSKWASVWGLLAPFIFPMSILAIMAEGPGISIVFIPFLLIVGIPLIKAYKKRKEYIESRLVYTLKGTVWFDEERYLHRLNDKELKLHRKWKKAFKKVNMPIENAEIEVFKHTFDTLDHTPRLSFQPIALKSSALKINELILKSTPGWGLPFLYAIAFGSVAYGLTLLGFDRHVLLDPKVQLNPKADYYFALFMSVLWWVSIVATVYLTYVVLSRMIGCYFYKRVK